MRFADGEPVTNVVVDNPVHGTALNVCDELDDFVYNPFLGRGSCAGFTPDYTKLPEPISELDVYHGWRENCPLHYMAACGDVDAVRDLLRSAANVNKVFCLLLVILAL